MIRILLNGCNGKMGQAVTRSCMYNDKLLIVAGVDTTIKEERSYPVYTEPNLVKEEVDIVCTKDGGQGAVREFIEYILKNH